MARRRLIVALAVLAAALLAAPARADQQAWNDGADAGLAPDMGAILGDWSSDGALAIAVGLAQRGWYIGDRVYLYLDTDVNGATGERGADYMVVYERRGDGEGRLLGRWVGNGYDYDTPQRSLLVQAGTGNLVFGVDGSEVGYPREQLRFWLYSVYANPVQSPFDWAPNSGFYLLRQSAVGGAASPAPAPAPATPAPAPAATPAPAAAAPSAPALLEAPRLRGQARVGRRLRASTGQWSGGVSAVRRQWLRDGRPIRGATRRGYRVRAADRGRRIACRVTAIGPGGRSSAVTGGRRVR